MNAKAEYLDDLSGDFTVLILCYPDRFSENTGPYQVVLAELFDNLNSLRSCIKQDMDKLDEFEAGIRRALALMESGKIKAGKFLLQDLEKQFPSLAKLK